MSVESDISRLGSLIRQLQGALAGRSISTAAILGNTGAVVRGSGISCVRTGTGDYTLTFDPAFSTIPVVSLTAAADAVLYYPKMYGGTVPTGSTMRIATLNPSTGALVDGSFNVIAVGPH